MCFKHPQAMSTYVPITSFHVSQLIHMYKISVCVPRGKLRARMLSRESQDNLVSSSSCGTPPYQGHYSENKMVSSPPNKLCRGLQPPTTPLPLIRAMPDRNHFFSGYLYLNKPCHYRKNAVFVQSLPCISDSQSPLWSALVTRSVESNGEGFNWNGTLSHPIRPVCTKGVNLYHHVHHLHHYWLNILMMPIVNKFVLLIAMRL